MNEDAANNGNGKSQDTNGESDKNASSVTDAKSWEDLPESISIFGHEIPVPKLEMVENGVCHFAPPEGLTPFSLEERFYYSFLLRILRMRAKMTVVDVARASGLKFHTVNHLESGYWPASRLMARRLAPVLAVTPESLYPPYMEKVIVTRHLLLEVPETVYDLLQNAVDRGIAKTYKEVVLIALAKLFDRPDILETPPWTTPRMAPMKRTIRKQWCTACENQARHIYWKLPPHPTAKRRQRRRIHKRPAKLKKHAKNPNPEAWGERRKKAMQLITEHPDWSMCRIARELGVSHTAVRYWTEVADKVREYREKRKREKQAAQRAEKKKAPRKRKAPKRKEEEREEENN